MVSQKNIVENHSILMPRTVNIEYYSAVKFNFGISQFPHLAAIAFSTGSSVKTGVGFRYKLSAAIQFRRLEPVANIAKLNSCRNFLHLQYFFLLGWLA